MHKLLFATLLAAAALPACKGRQNDPPAPDNTAKNDRDHAAVPTADNAGNSAADRDLTQKIRKAVMDDSSLSTNAHNCKIVVENGAVTLVGPVASDAERTKLEQIAVANAGDRTVVNKLEVTK
jgi:hyperosmotically inducible periplasmic protein